MNFIKNLITNIRLVLLARKNKKNAGKGDPYIYK